MTLSAALLVGGRSQRMGSDKATLLVGTEPLWARQLRLLRSLKPQVIYLSARISPPWRPGGIEVALDGALSRGPLSGISATLNNIQTTHLLVLAIDLPQMTPVHLAKLWALAQLGQGVIPLNGDRFEPLCAVYPKEAACLAEEVLVGEDVSLQQFSRLLMAGGRACAYSITAGEKPLYLNANTPEDLAGL